MVQAIVDSSSNDTLYICVSFGCILHRELVV
jgi:hypothetical protein